MIFEEHDLEFAGQEKFAGQEGWFTPADLHCHASGGKPPFLTCKFSGAWADL